MKLLLLQYKADIFFH